MRGASDMGWWAGGDSLWDIIQDVGATAGIKICLDAGARESYDGTSQQWSDMSGNGAHFALGATGTVETTDPTFNGVAGRLSSGEYFSTDGGDLFTYAASTPAWMQTLHKDAARFSMLAVSYSTGAGYEPLMSTMRQSSDDIGAMWCRQNTNKMRLLVGRGTAGTFSADITTDATIAAGWHVHAVSVDEAAASGFFWCDGGYLTVGGSNTFDATYASPSTSNASYPARVLSAGNIIASSGARIAGLAVWQGTTLSKTSLDTIYAQLRRRFGL